jgi:phage gp36-like protein
MANALAIEPHESGAETASASGAAVDIGALRSAARLRLTCTAVSGTNPTLVVKLQTAPTESGPWRTAYQFVSLSAAAVKDSVTVAGLDRYVRADWTIGGTDSPTFTFGLAGEAHVLYATSRDLVRHGLKQETLNNIDPDTLADTLLGASDEADGYLGGGYTLPLTAWSEDLRKHVAKMASYDLMSVNGFRPTGFDELIVKGRDDAVSWLSKIMAGKLEPPGIVDSTVEVFEAGGYVVSSPSRGW